MVDVQRRLGARRLGDLDDGHLATGVGGRRLDHGERGEPPARLALVLAGHRLERLRRLCRSWLLSGRVADLEQSDRVPPAPSAPRRTTLIARSATIRARSRACTTRRGSATYVDSRAHSASPNARSRASARLAAPARGKHGPGLEQPHDRAAVAEHEGVLEQRLELLRRPRSGRHRRRSDRRSAASVHTR